MREYKVRYRERGTATSVWRILRDGVEVDMSPRKRDAVKRAKDAAKGEVRDYGENAKVVIEKQSGAVQNTVTYGDDVEPSSSQPWMP